MRFAPILLRPWRSRVARRVFLLCVLCSLLPTLVIGALVYTRIATEETAAARTSLQETAKQYGMLLQERLVRAEEELIEAGHRHLIGQQGASGPAATARISAVAVNSLDAMPRDGRD